MEKKAIAQKLCQFPSMTQERRNNIMIYPAKGLASDDIEDTILAVSTIPIKYLYFKTFWIFLILFWLWSFDFEVNLFHGLFQPFNNFYRALLLISYIS